MRIIMNMPACLRLALLWWLTMWGSTVLMAQNTPLVLQAYPQEGGTVSGAGSYVAGQSVTVRATTATNFSFLYWTDVDGVVVSSSSQFWFTKTASPDTLIAHFQFSPGNPGEPAEPQEPEEPDPDPVYYRLTVMASPSEGGTVTGGNASYLSGTKVTVRATTSTNFTFQGWYLGDGTRVSGSLSYQHTTREQADTLTARFAFSPGSPGEPAEPQEPEEPEPDPVYYRLTVMASPSEGGTVTGGNASYVAGTKVTVRATTSTNFTFQGWYRPDDTRLSTSLNYQYTTREQADTLQARFLFAPGSPGDPSEPEIIPPEPPTPTHLLELSASPAEGGTVNFLTKTMEEGNTTTVTATASTHFVFAGWYAADTLYASARSFTFRMGTEDVHLEARFAFSPGNPGDPSESEMSKYAFFLMNRVGKPGDMLRMPVNFTSLDSLRNVSFRLTFPTPLLPDLARVVLSSKAKGYDLRIDAVNDSTWTFVLTGGQTPPGNMALVTVTVPIPADMPTGVSFPVKINQVSVQQTDGETVTASTRNGRLSVYRYGDTNGDNMVDLQDKKELIAWILSQTSDDYYEEVWDVNNDGKVDVRDALRILEMIKEQEAESGF